MSKTVVNANSPQVLDFISTPQEEPVKEERPQPTAEPIPKGYKLDKRYVETKTKRLQLVLKPSVYTALHKYCKAKKISINEFIGATLEEMLIEKEK